MSFDAQLQQRTSRSRVSVLNCPLLHGTRGLENTSSKVLIDPITSQKRNKSLNGIGNFDRYEACHSPKSEACHSMARPILISVRGSGLLRGAPFPVTSEGSEE